MTCTVQENLAKEKGGLQYISTWKRFYRDIYAIAWSSVYNLPLWRNVFAGLCRS